VIGADGDWQDRVGSWLPAHGVDAWVWQREVAEPAEYVALWLRDGGEQPGTVSWNRRYHRWLDWFAEAGVAAVGMGLVNLRRTGEPSRICCEDVPQAYQPPIGPAIEGWFERTRWLAGADLLSARLVAAPGLVLTTRSLLGESGWDPALRLLTQSAGMRWELEVDSAVEMMVAACTGEVPIGLVLELLAGAVGLAAEDVARTLAPVLTDLVQRGLLLPVELASGGLG